MTCLYQTCLQPANDDSSHVRITIYVGTCSSWFLKPSGAKDNGSERSAGSVRRIVKEMRGEDHKERRMDRWTCSIRRSRGSPPVSTSLSILEADSRVVPQRPADLSHRGLLFFVQKTARKYTGTGPRTALREAATSMWVALACQGLIRF